MSIHIVKVKIEGYIINLDGDNKDRLPVYDWPPETVINEMQGCVVSTRILDTIAEEIDSVKSDYQQDVEDAVDAAIDGPRRKTPEVN